MSNKNLYMVVVGGDTTLGYVKSSSTAGARDIVLKQWSKHQHNDGAFAVHFVCRDFTYESQFVNKDATQLSSLGYRGGLTSQKP